MIAATTWEEVAQESAGNRYMERIQEEMVKMSQDERDRYLYLREEMAASDRVSQLQSAENRGVRAGKLLNQISMIQKKVNKIENGKFSKSTNENILKFRDFLNEHGIVATVRRELGSDIDAACGQLRRKNLKTQ